MITAIAAAVVVTAAGVWLLGRRRRELLAENNDWVGEDLATRKQAMLAADLGAHHRQIEPEPPKFMRGGWGPEGPVWRCPS